MPCAVLVQPPVYAMPSMQANSAAASYCMSHTTEEEVEYATIPNRLPRASVKSVRPTRSFMYSTTFCQFGVPIDPERSTTSIASVTQAVDATDRADARKNTQMVQHTLTHNGQLTGCNPRVL